MFKFITIALALLAAPALAEDYCRATLNADEILIDRDTLDRDAPGLRERLGRWPSAPLNRLRGREPACDSETLISFLSTNVPEEEIDGYCLLPDAEFGYLLAPGARDYRGRCTATTCERVNTARDGAVNIAGTATDIITRRDADQTRTEAIKHASGAAILTGTAGSILASLGTGASTAVTAALAAPVVAGAAAVSVVAVGGAVWLCR